jgi:hypothetical protein
MGKSGNKSRFKLQIINKSALILLAVLLGIVAVSSIWIWSMMLWIPEKSYQGKLPPLKRAEITLRIKDYYKKIKKSWLLKLVFGTLVNMKNSIRQKTF